MKILVVDDSHFNLSSVKRILEDMQEISKIFLCDDPRQAKAIVDEYQIDILITDVMMPAITGYELLSLFRNESKYDDMPIIMLTSLIDMEVYKKCFALGAFDYINKPFNTAELHSRLKVAIDAKNKSNNLKSLLEVTKKQNEELKIINAELTEAKFSLVQAEKMAAIGQLAAGIAHEINNPMGYITSNFDILKKYYDRIKDYLDYSYHSLESEEFSCVDCKVIEKLQNRYKDLKLEFIVNDLENIFTDLSGGMKRITDIVQSLRVYARTSNDNDRDTNVLIELINQVILIIKNEVKYVAHILLDVPEDIKIYCNRIHIGQVFVNIILNSIQAIKSQNRTSMGTIKITAKYVMDKVQIEFHDDGPGIAKEHLHKIFEPFFTTKEIGQGTGLGLSISYDIIVNKHNGSFDVTSELGEGTNFIISLPIVPLD